MFLIELRRRSLGEDLGNEDEECRIPGLRKVKFEDFDADAVIQTR